MSNQSVGFDGEELATSFLQSIGFFIIERNSRNKFGEIDIIASKKDLIYFFEVKSRTSSYQGKPYDNVHELKVRHLTRAIQCYIGEHNLHTKKFQLDVISVEFVSGEKPRIKRYENIPITAY